jgi:hypothetical protein
VLHEIVTPSFEERHVQHPHHYPKKSQQKQSDGGGGTLEKFEAKSTMAWCDGFVERYEYAYAPNFAPLQHFFRSEFWLPGGPKTIDKCKCRDCCRYGIHSLEGGKGGGGILF